MAQTRTLEAFRQGENGVVWVLGSLHNGAQALFFGGLPMFQEIVDYLGHHPVVLSSIGVFILLAVIGAWYVVSHHLHALLVTLLCAAGFAAGALVLYRGYQSNMRDLMAVGAFFMVIFPIIYQQAIKFAKVASTAPSALDKGHAKRTGRFFRRPSSA
jgi:hypothetical protein